MGSKTTKLILLDSLLQEVCISSGFDGSLTLEFARVECLSLSVTNLLYSGLKKAHLKMIQKKRLKYCIYFTVEATTLDCRKILFNKDLFSFGQKWHVSSGNLC